MSLMVIQKIMMGTEEPTAREHFPLQLCCFIVPLIQRDIRADKSGTLANKHAWTWTKYDTKQKKNTSLPRVISSHETRAALQTAALLDSQILYEDVRFTDQAQTPRYDTENNIPSHSIKHTLFHIQMAKTVDRTFSTYFSIWGELLVCS